MTLRDDLARAPNELSRFIRWHTVPTPGVGMGGIFPGEGGGAVNYEYANWLYGYRDACKALSEGLERRVRHWPRHWRSRRPGAGRGIEKALWAWDNRVASSVRTIVTEPLDSDADESRLVTSFQGRVVLVLDTYVETELFRLGGRQVLKPDKHGFVRGRMGYYLRPVAP